MKTMTSWGLYNRVETSLKRKLSMKFTVEVPDLGQELLRKDSLSP
jgi:hypothetical protein